jgi:farnesyl diphosphate synthase
MMSTTNKFFENALDHYLQYQQNFIDTLNVPDDLLQEAIIYVMQTPGKKFRALMVYATGQIFHLPHCILDPIALTIELIHAYSLVHDDLPAMDNDDFRRGQPSCHKAFDEATAILAGNALHHIAFSHLIEKLPPHISAQQTLNIMAIILKNIGPQGILSGQSMDLKILHLPDLSIETITQIHHLKTTALLKAITDSICEAAQADIPAQSALDTYVQHLGLAYQMFDDYGDVYATAQWGKNHSSDQSNQKTTFVSFYDQETLKSKISEELLQAKQAISKLASNEYLTDLILQLEQRLEAISLQ